MKTPILMHLKLALSFCLACLPLLLTAQAYQQVQLSATGGGYGYGVAISGDVAIIGAPSDSAGAVYVWERTAASTWSLREKLSWPGIYATWFGEAVALQGAYAVIGAPNMRLGPDQIRAGAAFIYKRDGQGNWQQMAMLQAPVLNTGDSFGQFVALSGRYALIAAPGTDHVQIPLGYENGAAYMFERDSLGENWTLRDTLWKPDSLSQGDAYAGTALAIWDNYAAVGASHEYLIGTYPDSISGSVLLFRRDSTGHWGFLQKLFIPNTDPFSPCRVGGFGHSLAFEGGQLLIGSPYDKVCNGSGQWAGHIGSVHVYERDSTGLWVAQGRMMPPDTPPQGRAFGWRMATSHGRMVVSAPGDSDILGPNTGAIYFMERQADGHWIMVNKAYEPPGLAAFDNMFGTGPVALDRYSALAGTFQFNRVLHYERCTARHQVVKLTRCEAVDFFGHWLDSTGTYLIDPVAPTSWSCDSLSATVQFDLVAVDTSVVRAGDSLLATATQASFQWVRCGTGYTPIPGATSAAYVPDTMGFYAVEVTQQGCTEVSACRFVVRLTSQDSPLAPRLRLYPNPSQGLAWLDLSALSLPAKVTVFDAAGRRILARQASPGTFPLDLAALGATPGLYLVLVQAGTETAILRMRWE